jgi:hypothetical protein
VLIGGCEAVWRFRRLKGRWKSKEERMPKKKASTAKKSKAKKKAPAKKKAVKRKKK